MTPPRRPPRTPLSELALLQREVNQLFERLAAFERSERHSAGEWCPSVDVYECRDRLVVAAEVPGLAPDSLKVVCRDHELVIAGERRERRPAGAVAAFLCMERPQGRFVRRIPVDGALNLSEAEARLAGGVLTITIPRLKDRRGREAVIPVRRDEEA
jgi:HSP20 family protein